jgi:hypothetical protein
LTESSASNNLTSRSPLIPRTASICSAAAALAASSAGSMAGAAGVASSVGMAVPSGAICPADWLASMASELSTPMFSNDAGRSAKPDDAGDS